ncbi:hypothetical protein CEP52_007070 [Fusarium oligoseptatum]|uniref:Uncharacterized protein n=1 Tax=Fusarium oligoseptatum TaxID=2604345 RepID=A0A428TPW7_9HYPO|nr:hypothetical protein CEP52_007070 [Fusarium oligoseptatum]
MAQYKEITDIEMTSRPLTPKSYSNYSETIADDLGRYDAIRNEPTNDSEVNLFAPEPEPQPGLPRRRYNTWRSIGKLRWFTLVFGTLVNLASCAFLVFLWKGAEAAADRQKTNPSWEDIVFDNWAPGTATICSAVLRTSMNLQLGVFVSALSAIMLETCGVCFEDIPIFSPERALLSSPTNIVLPVLKRSKRGFSGLIYSFIIVTGVIVMVLSNLISTVLLSDFSTKQIAAPIRTQHLKLTFNESAKFREDNGVSYWKSKPAAWRFAEYRVGEPSVGDTGDTYRALLPFLNETARASLEYYDGRAMVVNTRTICRALPLEEFSIEQNATRVEKRQLKYTNGYYFAGEQSTRYPDSGPLNGSVVLHIGRKGHKDTHLCQMHSNTSDATSWPISLCVGLPGVRSILHKNESDPNNGKYYAFWEIVIINTTSQIEYSVGATDPGRDQSEGWKSKKKGLWTTGYLDGKEVFNASICHFNVYRPLMYKVTMKGQTIPFEPNGTEGVRRQLDPEESSWEARGILNLTLHKKDGQDDFKEDVDPTFNVTLGEHPVQAWSAWNMMYDGESDLRWKAHRDHGTTFQSIIQEKGDPTIAIQALGTRIHQMIYYDWLKDFDRDYPVKTIHSTETLIPGRWIGLISVLILTGVHLVLVFATVALFLYNTKASALGNAWQAVAQIARTTDAVESADRMLDTDVNKWAKATGLDKEVYSLSESSEGNQIKIRLRNRKME